MSIVNSVRFFTIASGSKGNAAYLNTPHAQVLIDCGVGIRALTKAFADHRLDLRKLDAVFITHLHNDHIKGLAALLRKVPVRVYCHDRSAEGLTARLLQDCAPQMFDIATFNGDGFPHRDIDVLPMQVSHDSDPTVMYKFHAAGKRLAVVTDLGTADSQLTQVLGDLDLLLIESNHCPQLLKHGPYPERLKQRIRSQYGHLSNQQACEVVTGLGRLPRKLMLGHLSESNNSVRAVGDAFSRIETGLIPHMVATQHEPSPLLELSA